MFAVEIELIAHSWLKTLKESIILNLLSFQG
jgi:hypothetical protein